MKIGYYRADQEGTLYIIPEELVQVFDADQEYLDGWSYDEWNEINGYRYNPFDQFEEDYKEYIVEGEIFNYKIIMEE